MTSDRPGRTAHRQPGGATPGRGGGPMSDFVFVIGTGRCGSTVVHELLARHPEVGFMSNLDDHLRSTRLSRLNNAALRLVPPAATAKGRPRFAPSEGYRALARAVSPALRDACRDLTGTDATPWMQDRTRRFFHEASARQSKPVFLHKFTGWPRAGFLAAALPGARFVHVVRDGRAVANSLLQMPWWRGYEGPGRWSLGSLDSTYRSEWEASGRSYVLLAGLAWKVLIDSFADARRKVDEQLWLEVRHEDVVADPAAALARVLDFVALRPTPRFLARVERHPLRPDRLHSYRHELGGDDIATLDRSLAGHLAAFGYPVPSPGR